MVSATLKSCHVVGVFTGLVMLLRIAAASNVVIRVKYELPGFNFYNVQFTPDMFNQFYRCLCEEMANSCRANYNLEKAPDVIVTSVQNEDTSTDTVLNSYTCTNEATSTSMVCTKLQPVPDEGRYKLRQSFHIQSRPCSQTCVTIYWFNDGERVNDHSYLQMTCGSVTGPITTQTSSSISTNSTTNSESNDGDLSTAVIVGVVVAIIIIIVIVAVVIGIIFWRRRRPPPKRQSWPNLEATSNNTTSLDDALNYRYRQHPAAAQEDISNNNLHYGHDSNLQANHSSTDAVKKNNGTVEKHDYTEVDVTSKRGNNIVLGNISASGYDFADVPEEDKPQAKDGGKRVALVQGNKKMADDNGTEEDSDYSVIDDSEDKARQDSRGGSTAAGSTSLYSTAKTDDDFGYSTVKDNNLGKTPANLNNTNKSQDNISTPQNTAYSLAGNTENTISKDSTSTTPHIYSTFHDDNSKPQNPYNVLPDADQDPQTEPPLSKPSSNPTNPNTQPSRYSMANPMLDASFDKTAGNSIEIITLPSSATK